MRIISATFADLEQSDLGTKSRLANEISGVPILRRTVEHVASAAGIAQHIVLCPQTQTERVQRVLHGLGVEIVGVDGEPDSWRALTRAARKWSIDGWRGGLGGTTYFDEFCFPALLNRVLSTHTADAVFAYPAAAPLISPAITQRMIEQRERLGDQTRIVFSQAVPGLAGIVLDAAFIAELAAARSPIGSVFSYKPDWPRKDFIFHPACLELPVSLRYATGRLIADTDRSLERIHAALREVASDSDEAMGQWLIDRDETHVEPFPREVEIELTTVSPYPRSLLRPAVRNARGPIDLKTVEKLAAELGGRDDVLVVLGGHGDPMRHPHFDSLLALFAKERPYGLAIRAFAADLDEQKIELLISHKVDVLCVMLDAWTQELYQHLHEPSQSDVRLNNGHAPSRRVSTLTPAPLPARESGCALSASIRVDPRQNPVPLPARERSCAGLQHVLGRLGRLEEARQAARSIVPVVVPEFCKAKENVQEMDAFYDGWLRRTGTASIVGYSHCAGQLENRGVVNMEPPVRSACRRLRTRCVVLANGQVTACDQDREGAHPLGSLHEAGLSQIWQSVAYEQLREMHAKRCWEDHPLCGKCAEWHRP